MKKIISIVSLVLLLAISLTACGSKNDYEESSRDYSFEKLKITLTESFGEQKNQKDSYAVSDYVTYTSQSMTSVTIKKENGTSTADYLAAQDLLSTKQLLNSDKVTINVVTLKDKNDQDTETLSGETTDKTSYCYYIFSVKDSSGEYVFFKAFLNEGSYSYSVCMSVTAAAYEKQSYKDLFIKWLNTVTIATETAES